MNNIINIEDYIDDRHVTIQTIDNNVHVLPWVLFKRLVAGEIKITDIDDYDKIIISIVDDWMNFLENQLALDV